MNDEHLMIPMGSEDEIDESGGPPTIKERNAVQQEVGRLLDAFAPERAAHRMGAKEDVERHRTPRGCILQAANGAVTVSWFPDSARGRLSVRPAPRSSRSWCFGRWRRWARWCGDPPMAPPTRPTGSSRTPWKCSNGARRRRLATEPIAVHGRPA